MHRARTHEGLAHLIGQRQQPANAQGPQHSHGGIIRLEAHSQDAHGPGLKSLRPTERTVRHDPEVAIRFKLKLSMNLAAGEMGAVIKHPPGERFRRRFQQARDFDILPRPHRRCLGDPRAGEKPAMGRLPACSPGVDRGESQPRAGTQHFFVAHDRLAHIHAFNHAAHRCEHGFRHRQQAEINRADGLFVEGDIGDPANKQKQRQQPRAGAHRANANRGQRQTKGQRPGGRNSHHVTDDDPETVAKHYQAERPFHAVC